MSMHDGCSDLVEIARQNGDFKKNYGKLLGALLYLRSAELAGGSRPILRMGWLVGLIGLITALAKAWHWYR
jgi:hypothetical protein